MMIQLDVNNFMVGQVGKADGLRRPELNGLVPRVRQIHADLQSRRQAGDIGFYDLPHQDTTALQETAAEVAERFDTFVVLGIGGSSLGGRALITALRHPWHTMLPVDGREGRPRVFFLDNIDPDTHAGLFDLLDLERTCFNAISKSGTTAETNAQFLLFRDRLQAALGPAYRDHLILTTDRQRGNFRKIADEEHIRSFVIPDNVGGRFSVFTPVGLLPAAVSGIDIDRLLAGAAAMAARCENDDLWANPAYLNAVCHYLLDVRRGKSMAVMMSYSDGLLSVADWFRQLWAESLGKRKSLDGRDVYTGPTPITALGVTDQHSQLQLYSEGPNNKTFTFLKVESFRTAMPVPTAYESMNDLSYLGGHSLEELLTAEREATQYSLTQCRRPNCSITLPSVTEETVGQLLFMLEAQTALSGGLYNINPFDQPGVEMSKEFAYGLLGRAGFEARKKAMDGRPEGDGDFIL